MNKEKTTCDYKGELEKNFVIAIVPIGNSMWPTLKNKKQSVIVCKKTERLKALDVALYQREDGTYILHRIMQVTDFGYLMCGDSQFSFEKVNEDAVIGVMTAYYHGKKSIEVLDPKYKNKVKKWFANEKRRKKKVKNFFVRQNIKSKIKRFVKKLLGKKNV